jgi:hypothetical protein
MNWHVIHYIPLYTFFLPIIPLRVAVRTGHYDACVSSLLTTLLAQDAAKTHGLKLNLKIKY